MRLLTRKRKRKIDRSQRRKRGILAIYRGKTALAKTMPHIPWGPTISFHHVAD